MQCVNCDTNKCCDCFDKQMIIDNFTPSGHIIGMLDRDQRTARCYANTNNNNMGNGDENDVVDSKHMCHHMNVADDSSMSKLFLEKYRISSKRKLAWFCNPSRKSHILKILQRLKQVLVVGTYLLSIVSIPSALSAPTIRLNMSDQEDPPPPKWINPCGGSELTVALPLSPDKTQLSSNIIKQATIALSRADLFKEEFIKKTFKMDFTNLHEMLKMKHYDWLPSVQEIPKNLGEQLDKEHLKSIQLNEALVNIYEYFQKIAVGLEQIVWDQKKNRDDFLDEFTDIDYGMKQVLCEVHEFMSIIGAQQREDITREHMINEYRIMNDTTSRSLRDWLIYRDYMNALEYAIQVFTHIKSNL